MTDTAFFILSKLFWIAATPSTALTLMALAGLGLSVWHARAGWVLAGCGVAGLALFGFGPFGRALTVPLENRFPAYVDDGTPVAGVVVLGGAELPDISAARGQPAYQESAERILALGELSRRYPQARLIFSGGSGDLVGGPAMPEAEVVRRTLPQIGVDPARVAFEPNSRNTAENAALSRALADPQPGERWLLVTSAMHMPRAVGSFRTAGFPVTAYPVDYRTEGTAQWTRLTSNVAEGLRATDTALREWIGLAAYRLSGRTGAWLPAP